MKKRFKIGSPLIRLLVSLAIVVSLAVILSSFFFRIDLTTDRRYTLSPYTKKTLKELRDIVDNKIASKKTKK